MGRGWWKKGRFLNCDLASGATKRESFLSASFLLATGSLDHPLDILWKDAFGPDGFAILVAGKADHGARHSRRPKRFLRPLLSTFRVVVNILSMACHSATIASFPAAGICGSTVCALLENDVAGDLLLRAKAHIRGECLFLESKLEATY